MKPLRSYLPTWNPLKSTITDDRPMKKSTNTPLLWTNFYTNYIKLRITSLDIPVSLRSFRQTIPSSYADVLIRSVPVSFY